MVNVGAGVLHFILSNTHFVANGFALACLRRTIV
jgi:hypothetical protein